MIKTVGKMADIWAFFPGFFPLAPVFTEYIVTQPGVNVNRNFPFFDIKILFFPGENISILSNGGRFLPGKRRAGREAASVPAGEHRPARHQYRRQGGRGHLPGSPGTGRAGSGNGRGICAHFGKSKKGVYKNLTQILIDFFISIVYDTITK